MKFSINSKCPCGSNKKYKQCCMIYHKGAKPKDALLLMKSRYSAYAIGNTNYILKTTHPNNLNFTEDETQWKSDIKSFCDNTDFLRLEIIDYNLDENISFVTFKAKLSSGDMVEKSKFLKENGIWLYESGEVS
jgi:SEC-C motif-containing protein